MRKSYTYTPCIPSSRNEFIDMVNSKSDVILVKHDLLKKLSKEINDSIDGRRIGKLGTRCGPVMMAVSWWNPISLAAAGVLTLCGIVGVSADKVKHYEIYAGEDIEGNAIIALHRKTVNLKYDTVDYPEWVKTVNTHTSNKKIRLKKSPAKKGE